MEHRRGSDDDQREGGDGGERRTRRRLQLPFPRCGDLPPPRAVRVDQDRGGGSDEQRHIAHRLQRQRQRGDEQQELIQRGAAERKAGDRDQDHRLERQQVALMEVGREPLDDQLLLRHAAHRVEGVEIDAEPVRSGEHRHRRRGGDDAQELQVRPVSGVSSVPRPHHGLRGDGDAEPDEPDDPATVEIGPQRHHKREVQEHPAASAEIGLQPVQLEARERERDHLRARPPDGVAGHGGQREADADDHERLAPDLTVHQPEAEPRDHPERDRDADRAGAVVDEPHQDLGQVLVVRPDVAWHRVREDVGRRQPVVVGHPAADPDVPQEVGVLFSRGEQGTDDDQDAAQ